MQKELCTACTVNGEVCWQGIMRLRMGRLPTPRKIQGELLFKANSQEQEQEQEQEQPTRQSKGLLYKKHHP